MSTTGGMCRAATIFFKRLASLLSEKREEEGVLQQDHGLDSLPLEFCPSESLHHIDQGARSSAFHPGLEGLQEPFDLQLAEGHVH